MRSRTKITIPDAARARAIASLRRYVAENLDEEIGDLKAALLLDYILAEHGPTIYNQALGDARKYFEERAADLDAAWHPEFPFWEKSAR
jgi:uncharacterized protein (DUF2164 family)